MQPKHLLNNRPDYVVWPTMLNLAPSSNLRDGFIIFISYNQSSNAIINPCRQLHHNWLFQRWQWSPSINILVRCQQPPDQCQQNKEYDWRLQEVQRRRRRSTPPINHRGESPGLYNPDRLTSERISTPLGVYNEDSEARSHLPMVSEDVWCEHQDTCKLLQACTVESILQELSPPGTAAAPARSTHHHSVIKLEVPQNQNTPVDV